MNDIEWIEQQRQYRLTIMLELESLAKEVKKYNRKLEKEPQIDAGYKRKLEMIQANWKILLSITDKKLSNLSQKAELESALDKIKQEVEAIAEAQRRQSERVTFAQAQKIKGRKSPG